MDGIDLSVTGGVGTIRMSRERANAINSGTCRSLAQAFARAEEDPAVRAVLLTSGAKLFCPGLDLPELVTYDRATLRRFMEEFSAWVLALVDFPKPVVAAIGGHAVAGGCVLALTADWRVLVEGAQIGLNEVRIGVPLPFGVARLLQEQVPPQSLAEIGLLGRNLTGREALAAGLVHELCEPGRFEAVCRARAEEFASRDGAAFSVTKRYLRAEAAEALRAADGLYLDDWLDCWFSDGARQRIGEIVAGLQARRA